MSSLIEFLRLKPFSILLFADTVGIYAHPTPENRRKAVEVLAAVFGGGSEKVADGQTAERTGIVTPMSENLIAVDFNLDLF